MMLANLLVAVLLGQAPAVPTTGTDAGAAAPVVQSDMDAPLWVHFWWKEPRLGACGFRAEPGEYVIIDWKSEIFARAERVGPALARVLVWSHASGSDDPVAEVVLPVPGETTIECARVGPLCSGVVKITIREVDDP